MEGGTFKYGKLDAAAEPNVGRVQSCMMGNTSSTSDDTGLANPSDDEDDDDIDGSASVPPEGKRNTPDGTPAAKCHLIHLPAELLDQICLSLTPEALEALRETCRVLRLHATQEKPWQEHVQSNVPGCMVKSPYPCATFRELYYAHDPQWFLTKSKIWFSDLFLTGRVIVARYDPRRGCIEAYRLVAERSDPEFEPWEHDDEVVIHSFRPRVKLHLDQPVLHLGAISIEEQVGSRTDGRAEKYNRERPMQVHERLGASSNFMFTRSVDVQAGMQVWPPRNIPATQRVRNASHNGFSGGSHRPHERNQVCPQAFRIRRWVRMLYGAQGDVQTFSTLDEKLYTPTADKPWRGIWVGDYAGHGCEFLLMHQPEIEPLDHRQIVRQENEPEDEWQIRVQEARLYRGSIEAIKLTGDPNVPRGEHTFIADDISSTGLVRRAEDQRFNGARIVRSRGHIAEQMYRNDKWIESELIMISPNQLAQHWIGFGHISYFERVQIDQFLSPSYDGRP